MIRDTQALLSYEIAHRPKLAMMIERGYTIDDAETSGFPKWIRLALIARLKLTTDVQSLATSAAMNADLIVDGTMPDPLGEMRKWISSTTFVDLDRGQLQVETGALIWIPMSGGVWFETLLSHRIDPRVRSMTAPMGLITKSGYTAAYKALLAGLIPTDSITIGDRSNALSAYGVRFK